MGTTVYLVGHGRVSAKATPASLPANITMHWLGPLGDVTAGLSYAFLSGKLTAELEPSAPLISIPEHYLCADKNYVHDGKLKEFFSRPSPHPHGSGDPYVLYTRPDTDVPLSSIFRFLAQLSSTIDWHVYWTCCRGYIGVANQFKTMYDSKSASVVRQHRGASPPESGEVGPKGKDGHRLADAGFDTVTLVAKSDYGAVQGKRNSSVADNIEAILGFRAVKGPNTL